MSYKESSAHRRTWNNVKLWAKNGVPSRVYSFKEMKYTGNNGNDYGKSAIKGCAKIGKGWKPVCDHPSYCKNDKQAIYIGQSYHLAYGGHWNNNYMPKGLLKYKRAFRQDSMCYYTGRHGGNHQALCARGGSHAWRRATQSPHYMCAKVSLLASVVESHS